MFALAHVHGLPSPANEIVMIDRALRTWILKGDSHQVAEAAVVGEIHSVTLIARGPAVPLAGGLYSTGLYLPWHGPLLAWFVHGNS